MRLTLDAKCKDANMAKFIESWVYEGIEGKPWAEVKARVLEFKAALLEKGAPEVNVREGSFGAGMGTFTLEAVFPSAAAWGAFADSFDDDAAWEAKMSAWQANPKLMGKSGSIFTEVK